MYITYCRDQKSVDLEDRTSYRLSVTGGEYRPTWLVRVSDWEKVPGKEAVDGYHTISYCWEQSGEVVKHKTDDGDDEYNVVDNGKHCIVEGYKLYEDDIIRPADDIYVAENNIQEMGDIRENLQVNSDVEEHEKSNNQSEYVLRCEPKSKTTSIRYVTYNQLLQQICKDFQVEYVWYDKVCIDQSDKKAKLNKIKQMHKIYSNARYTVAMVPEGLVYDLEHFNLNDFSHGHKAKYYFINDLWGSCWFKRSWTLEEVMMSRRILIVGTNTTMFQHSLHSSDIPTTIESLSDPLLDFGGGGQNKGSVNQALAFAHFRRSTKSHDMIYALKNTFSYMFDDMEVSYSADIKTVFNDFYRHVAIDDLSILCFGSNRRLENGNINLESTMNNYNLPSWTGVAGIHAQNRVIATVHPQLIYHIDDIMRMHITTSRYRNISITPYEYGCYSLSKNHAHGNDFIMKESDRINNARHNGDWTDMSTADKNAVLLEWFLNTQSLASAFMTHYHEPQDGSLTQIRPLTLIEDCEECIVLPILLEMYVPVHLQSGDNVSNFRISDYERRYCLPVLHECSEATGQYKAVGIYYIGDQTHFEPAFKWSHVIGRESINTDASVEIIDILFENHSHDVAKEFIIK